MLSLRTRMLLLATVALMGAAAFAFHGAQNGGHGGGAAAMGGAISTPKMLWLTWAVGVWFFVTAIVALDGAVAVPLRRALGVFAVLMWARGIAEMLLLYVFFAWKPPYGIAHDALCVVVLGAALVDARSSARSALDRRVLALGAVVVCSLLVEMTYAYLFFQAVEGRTTGEAGIWFADETDPRFVFINRLTTFFNVPLYGFLAAFLWRALREKGPHAQPAA